MASITVFIMLIRSVDEDEMSMAIGLAEFFNSILAWLPGPIVFGKLVDRVCMIWDSSCNSVGNCVLYSLPDFRYVFNGLICGFELSAVIFLTITLYFRICLDKRNAAKEPKVEVEVEMPIDYDD
ncbi:hypothetical protein LOTGIDRAFT_174219 [Lottia gigantea]|uniref:Uncharacterized protein n=1 Tax=Lottia gigantea TaxID=225164 RepID=V4C9U0_LOTGI|nr:hypothetical protein LOTGIDRAFT_174219 [Lottia gigantea]ESO98534.1 hypothetical protein LOTGIDRAFT_174219 [Lottia gigantea]